MIWDRSPNNHNIFEFIMSQWSNLSNNSKFWIVVVTLFVLAITCLIAAPQFTTGSIIKISLNLISTTLFVIFLIMILFSIIHFVINNWKMDREKSTIYNTLASKYAVLTLCIVIIVVFYYGVSLYQVPGYMQEGITAIISALIGGLAADILIKMQ